MTPASDQRPSNKQRPPIHRVRTGCFSCRGRKKKCDEIKPICSGCRRNGLNCSWPTLVKPARKTKQDQIKKTVKEAQTAGEARPSTTHPPTEVPPRERRPPQPSSPEETRASASLHEATQSNVLHFPSSGTHLLLYSPPKNPSTPPSSHSESPEAISNTFIPGRHPSVSSGSSSSASLYSQTGHSQLASNTRDANPAHVCGGNGEGDIGQDFSDASDPMSIDNDSGNALSSLIMTSFDPAQASGFSLLPRALGPLPGADTHSFELLSYYLSRTAISMGNGSTDVNPFVSQIIPLSFAKPFILDLVLGQSAAHRATGDASKLQVAQGYYNKSLRLLRTAIDDYVRGKEKNPLWIAIGALIMCFTESAKGDINGVIFDHINVVGPLLSGLLSKTDLIRGDLRDFIVEYYVYTATISMISIDPTFGTTPFLSPDLELQARKLAESGYLGHLCGCWLQLLVLIPRIFEFGQRARGGGDSATILFPTANDFVTFSTLQAQIMSFEPSTFAFPGTDVALAGNIYKHALHIYLLTTLDSAETHDSKLNSMINDSIEEGFKSLEQLSPEVRINTSLCWPLVVLGSCVEDANRRDQLRSRIRTMFRVLGLGNMRATGVLLDEMWQLPRSERSPWMICRIMQDQQTWISFV